MKVKIIRPTFAGGMHLGVGAVAELPVAEAQLLCRLNKAVPAVETIQTREPEVVNREPEVETEATKKPRKTKA